MPHHIGAAFNRFGDLRAGAIQQFLGMTVPDSAAPVSQSSLSRKWCLTMYSTTRLPSRFPCFMELR